ncbi:MAG: hypothetical protein GEV11_29245 [Streptosporangiales bacterium]|nr:hypothetical protein [Streptosporangiales bacterium]
MPAQPSRWNRLHEWARRAGPATFDVLQSIIAIGGVLIVLLIHIPWLQNAFERLGFGDTNKLTLTVITVLLASTYYEVASGKRRAGREEIDRHFPDPMDVYPVLQERMRTIRRPEERTLDVIGMSLYTAWPTIRFLLARPDLAGWKIRLAAVVDVHLRARNITLEAYGYDFMPVVHGFRLGNGDLFYSILLWQDDGRIGREGYSYEYVPAEDNSASASATREMFDSWLHRACHSPWPTPDPA